MNPSREEPNLQAILAAIETDQVDVDNAIIRERNQDMHLVKQDLQQLKDVTFDVASMVVEQGDQLSVGQKRTNRSRMAVEAGTRELRFARKYKNKSRSKCFCATFCVIFLLLLGGGFVFLTQYKDGVYWQQLKDELGV